MKRVFTNGCFDILHRGHFELLKFCKSLGEVIVGLNSDNSIKKIKGELRPLNSQEDRKFMLENCKHVDEVIIFNDKTPLKLIQSLKPDIIVKGGDYEQEEVAGHELCEVVIFNFMDGYSTTKIMEKINESQY